MSNRIRYSRNEVARGVYYQLPKFLFMDEFKKLNNDARVLYSVLRDRHDLSIRNEWVNENDEVYLIFSREEMCELLGVSLSTIFRTMKILKEFDLIEEERIGLGKPNMIYLLTVKNIDNTQTRKIYGSGHVNFTGQDVSNIPPNKTEYNKTYTESSQSQSQSHAEPDLTQTYDDDLPVNVPISIKMEAPSTTTIHNYRQTEAVQKNNADYNTFLNLIKANIEYDSQYQDREFIDSIIQVMLDVILTESPGTVKIGKETKSREIVKSVYLKLNEEHIQHVIYQYKSQHHQITHKTSYLRTMLYNAFQEIEPHYVNQVRADGVVW